MIGERLAPERRDRREFHVAQHGEVVTTAGFVPEALVREPLRQRLERDHRVALAVATRLPIRWTEVPAEGERVLVSQVRERWMRRLRRPQERSEQPVETRLRSLGALTDRGIPVVLVDDLMERMRRLQHEGLVLCSCKGPRPLSHVLLPRAPRLIVLDASTPPLDRGRRATDPDVGRRRGGRSRSVVTYQSTTGLTPRERVRDRDTAALPPQYMKRGDSLGNLFGTPGDCPVSGRGGPVTQITNASSRRCSNSHAAASGRGPYSLAAEGGRLPISRYRSGSTSGGPTSSAERRRVSRVKVPTIIVTGPVGVGKSTVAEAMGYLLLAAKIPHANVDFDQLTACYPRPADDDQWGTRLGLANLAAMWMNYQRSGARRLIIARVVESRADLDGYRDVIPGADILLVRLRAAPKTLVARVRQRGPWRDLEWHLNRAVELAAQMDAQRVEDMLVETEDRDPTTIARDILHRAGWLST